MPQSEELRKDPWAAQQSARLWIVPPDTALPAMYYPPPSWYGPPPMEEPPAQRGRAPKLAYSVDEAAQALGVSRSTMYKLIQRSDFPTLRVGGRRMISAELLAEWVRRQAGG